MPLISTLKGALALTTPPTDNPPSLASFSQSLLTASPTTICPAVTEPKLALIADKLTTDILPDVTARSAILAVLTARSAIWAVTTCRFPI